MKTLITLILAVVLAVAVAAGFAFMGGKESPTQTPEAPPLSQDGDVALAASPRSDSDALAQANARIGALVEINSALVDRVEKLEKRITTWERAQSATYALQEEIRLRLETLGRDFVRFPVDVERSGWTASGANYGPLIPSKQGEPDSFIEPDLPVP